MLDIVIGHLIVDDYLLAVAQCLVGEFGVLAINNARCESDVVVLDYACLIHQLEEIEGYLHVQFLLDEIVC